ncbi:Uncharacterised protein, partial [Mycoplasmopsis edwardii]
MIYIPIRNTKTLLTHPFLIYEPNKEKWYNLIVTNHKEELHKCNSLLFLRSFMDYKKMLTETFGDVIISAKLTDTFGKTLEVVVDYRDLNKVEEISKKISTYLDEQEW